MSMSGIYGVIVRYNIQGLQERVIYSDPSTSLGGNFFGGNLFLKRGNVDTAPQTL